jgi:hypothetical protein
MTKETQIYAKEQQILIVNNILGNLCHFELNNDGRIYLNKIKARIKEDLLRLKSHLMETTANS